MNKSKINGNKSGASDGSQNKQNFWRNFRWKMHVEDQIHFVERLSFLTKAHIPLLQSLQMIAQATVHKKTHAFLLMVIEDVSSGQSLSLSLFQRGGIINEFVLHMMNIGEMGGVLSENLHYISLELKKRNTLTKKIRGALLYPAFITVATSGITAMLMFYIFPKILPIFKSMHVNLPASTRILLMVNDLIIYHWLSLLVSLIFTLLFTLCIYRRSVKVRQGIHELLLKTPIIKKVVKNYYMAHFCRTSGLLLKSNISITEVFHMNHKAVANLVYKKIFLEIMYMVTNGETIASSLRKYQTMFPVILVQMISVGEATGSLSESFLYLSELFETEVDEFAKTLSTSIEPILMVGMGLVVGFVAVSIISPIYQITQNLHA